MAVKAPSPNSLVTACLELLALRRVPAWRNNSGAVRFGTRYVRFGGPGTPDVFAILPPVGRLLCLEMKTGTGRLSASQRAWHAAAGSAGAACFVIRSTGDLTAALDLLEKEGHHA